MWIGLALLAASCHRQGSIGHNFDPAELSFHHQITVTKASHIIEKASDGKPAFLGNSVMVVIMIIPQVSGIKGWEVGQGVHRDHH